MQVLLTAINSKYIHTGLGLRYVGEYAKEQGHNVALLEETINTPILAVLEKIMEMEYQVYGFSVHIWNRPYVFRLVRMLRQLRPEAVIVLGGPEVAFEAEQVLQEMPAVDYLVQGEGELPFAELLAMLEEGGAVPAHVAYRNQDGSINLNGGPTVLQDMSILPFPYPDLEQVKAEHKIVYYECTRGCPFNCSYCLSGITRSVRKRPLELVLADMDRFMAAGVELVKFVDRTYNLDERYFMPMLEYLAKADTKATFHFEIKADMLSERVMELLARAPKHRFQMEIGIQTTHQPTLKAINRQDNWEHLAKNVGQLLSFGNMHIHVDLIAGLPYEGIAEFEQSFNDVYGLQAHMLQLGFLKVLPGTQMRCEQEEHQLRYMQEPPYEILATKYMPYNDLQLLKRMENVFDQTGNTGAFPHILASLIKHYGKGAFAFYRRLTEWWVAAGHYPQGHNLRGTAQLLHAYITTGGDFAAELQPKLIEILRYDVFKILPGWYPEWLNWQQEAIYNVLSEFWRNEELVHRYLPDYSFKSWRQIHKSLPIERFHCHWDSEEEGGYYVLLDLRGEECKEFILDI